MYTSIEYSIIYFSRTLIPWHVLSKTFVVPQRPPPAVIRQLLTQSPVNQQLTNFHNKKRHTSIPLTKLTPTSVFIKKSSVQPIAVD